MTEKNLISTGNEIVDDLFLQYLWSLHILLLIMEKKIKQVLVIIPIPTGENSITKTKNTTENNKENTEKTTTTEEMVVCCCDDSLISYVKQKFIRYDLNDKDAVLIVNAATKGTEDIDRAYEYLINYNKTINSIVPFIVSTIKNGWKVQKVKSSNKCSDKDIHGFTSRQYDWDALEKELVNRF